MTAPLKPVNLDHITYDVQEDHSVRFDIPYKGYIIRMVADDRFPHETRVIKDDLAPFITFGANGLSVKQCIAWIDEHTPSSSRSVGGTAMKMVAEVDGDF